MLCDLFLEVYDYNLGICVFIFKFFKIWYLRRNNFIVNINFVLGKD